MKPYSKRELTIQERVHNYRLSRPRNIIENVFGMLAMVWRALLTKLSMKIETVKQLTLSICILHNILIGNRNINREYMLNFIDREDVKEL